MAARFPKARSTTPCATPSPSCRICISSRPSRSATASSRWARRRSGCSRSGRPASTISRACRCRRARIWVSASASISTGRCSSSPITRRRSMRRDPLPAVEELLAALDRFPDAALVFTKANADAGGRAINERFEAYVAKHPGRGVLIASLGQRVLSRRAQGGGGRDRQFVERPDRGAGGRHADGQSRHPAEGTAARGERDRLRRGARRHRTARSAARSIPACAPSSRPTIRLMGARATRRGAILERLREADLAGILRKRFHDLAMMPSSDALPLVDHRGRRPRASADRCVAAVGGTSILGVVDRLHERVPAARSDWQYLAATRRSNDSRPDEVLLVNGVGSNEDNGPSATRSTGVFLPRAFASRRRPSVRDHQRLGDIGRGRADHGGLRDPGRRIDRRQQHRQYAAPRSITTAGSARRCTSRRAPRYPARSPSGTARTSEPARW